jgi:hypothetical protein
VLDLLGEHDFAVAIVTRKRSSSIGPYGELPDLKFLRGCRFSLLMAVTAFAGRTYL